MLRVSSLPGFHLFSIGIKRLSQIIGFGKNHDRGIAEMENEKAGTTGESVIAFSCNAKEIELPRNIQKRMMDFFLKTSIPRRKAGNNGHLPLIRKDR